MYIPNDDMPNNKFCSLQVIVLTFKYSTYSLTQIPTNQNSIKVPNK